MGTFFGLEGRSGGRFPLRAVGDCGDAIRKASTQLSSFSPRFAKDLSDLGVVDATASAQPPLLGPCVPLLVGGRWDTSLAELQRSSVRVLMLGHQAGPAVWMGRALGEARVIALGAKEYTESQRDELRSTQRLLPGFEVTFERALRAATQELEEQAVFLSLHLNLFTATAVFEAEGCSFEGLEPSLVFRHIEILRQAKIIGFQLWGGATHMRASSRTSLLGAEILRHIIFAFWA